MKSFIAAPFLVVSSCACASAGDTEAEIRSVIANVEGSIVLPDSTTNPLHAYTRFYARVPESGKLQGIFVLGKPGGTKLVDTQELPVIFDGGCDVINVEIDMPTQRVVWIACAGVA